MNLPDRNRLGEVIDLFRIFHGGRGISPAETLPADVDARLAAAFGVKEGPFTTSIEAAFALRDHAYAGAEYVNVDLREYDDERGLVFMCDIRTENGESAGSAKTRPWAIVSALVAHLTYEMESVGE